GATRLLTITGPGGTGKTRLAVEAAARLADFFPSGIWFVPLADVFDWRLIAGCVISAMGIAPRPETDPSDQLLEAIPAEPCLLIVDNMEQLADSAPGIITT